MGRRRNTRRQDHRRRRPHHRAPAPFGITLGGWLLIAVGVMILLAQQRSGA